MNKAIGREEKSIMYLLPRLRRVYILVKYEKTKQSKHEACSSKTRKRWMFTVCFGRKKKRKKNVPSRLSLFWKEEGVLRQTQSPRLRPHGSRDGMSYHSVKEEVITDLVIKTVKKGQTTYSDRRRYFQEILLVSFGKNDPSNTTSMGSQDFTFYSPHLSMYTSVCC